MSDLHDEMMRAEGVIVVALEDAGFDPCPAIKIAQKAMEIAWDVWNRQAEEIDRLKACASRASDPAPSSSSAPPEP